MKLLTGMWLNVAYITVSRIPRIMENPDDVLVQVDPSKGGPTFREVTYSRLTENPMLAAQHFIEVYR
jgi:hypothetical protein